MLSFFGVPIFYKPLLAFVAAAFGSTFSKKLAAFCGYLNVFSKLSQFLFGILLDFRHLTCGFVRSFEIVAGMGLEAASKQNMTFVRSQQELTLF